MYSDQELIKKYQATKDVSYVGELYQRYTHLVFGVCLKYLKDEEDAKDATMQIFEKLLQALKTQEVSKFQNWLLVLVRNYCLMELRGRKSRENKSLLYQLPDFEGSFDLDNSATSDFEEKITHLESGLRLIPEEQRICLELFYLQQKCYQEIAQITGYNISKVKSYIQNGKRNLRIYLEKHHDHS